MFYITTAVRKIAALKKRIKAIQGGTSAGKTIGVLEVLIDKNQREDGKGDVTSVTSGSFPHLKRGAIRDFLSILETHNYFDPARWNKTDFTYTFEGGSIMEFFSTDQAAKVRGPRRKRLFINEADKLSLETFDQLEVRTNEEIYLDWNPSNPYFWFYTDVLGKRDDVEHLILTYKDNEALPETIVKAIEQRRSNKSWYRVFGLGLTGEVEGLIYKNWQEIEEIPQEAKLVRHWLDYGYTNDPTAIGDIYKWNDAFVLDEQLYQTGLQNNQIADFLLNLEQVPVASDSAEPKSNDELKLRGLTIIPARKGKDSINAGIQLVQQQKIFYTKRSFNIRKERLNYLWMTDKDGRTINVPSPLWNHHMDGIRYGFESLLDFIPDTIRVKQEQALDRNTFRQTLNSTK